MYLYVKCIIIRYAPSGKNELWRLNGGYNLLFVRLTGHRVSIIIIIIKYDVQRVVCLATARASKFWWSPLSHFLPRSPLIAIHSTYIYTYIYYGCMRAHTSTTRKLHKALCIILTCICSTSLYLLLSSRRSAKHLHINRQTQLLAAASSW